MQSICIGFKILERQWFIVRSRHLYLHLLVHAIWTFTWTIAQTIVHYPNSIVFMVLYANSIPRGTSVFCCKFNMLSLLHHPLWQMYTCFSLAVYLYKTYWSWDGLTSRVWGQFKSRSPEKGLARRVSLKSDFLKALSLGCCMWSARTISPTGYRYARNVKVHKSMDSTDGPANKA